MPLHGTPIRRLLTAVCSTLLVLSPAHATSKPPVITTWWPDLGSNLMWTGGDLASTGIGFTHDQAVQACKDLRLAGYADWRLPTVGEMMSAMGSFPVEVTQDYPSVSRSGITHMHSEDVGTRPAPGLIFQGAACTSIWTGEADDATHFIALRADTENFGPMPYKWLWHTFDTAATYCVRPLDPAIRTIAEAAHTNSPVPSVDYLQDVATVYAVEHTTALADMPPAITQAKAVTAHKNALAAEALNDAAFDEVLEGQFATANADLALAHKMDKNNGTIKTNIAWAKRVAADAATDPRTLPMWIALHKADVSRGEKNCQQALIDANAAIAVAPDWAEGYDRLAAALQTDCPGRGQESIAVFKKGMDLNAKPHSNIELKLGYKAAKKTYKQ